MKGKSFRHVRFANARHCSFVINDTSLFTWFPMWFSYFLLVLLYPAFLTMFWRLQYRKLMPPNPER